MKPSLIKFLKAHKEDINKPKVDYLSLFNSIYDELDDTDTNEFLFLLYKLRPKDHIDFYRLGKLNLVIENAFDSWLNTNQLPSQFEMQDFIAFWIQNTLGYSKKDIISTIKDVYESWSNHFRYIELSTGEILIKKGY
jgi:hypothetical protein